MQRCENVSDKAIAFYGGEPLTQFDRITSIISYVKEKFPNERVYFRIATNGTLMNETIIDFVIRNSVSLQVSLDGPEHIHDRYRVKINGSGTYREVRSNLETIRELDSEYFCSNVYFIVTLAPPYDMIAVSDYFDSAFPEMNALRVNHLQDEESTLVDRFLSGDKDLDNYTDQYLHFKREYITKRIAGINPTAFEKALFEDDMIRIQKRGIGEIGTTVNANGICAPGIRRSLVDVDGDMYPCERSGTAFHLGNVEVGLKSSSICKAVEEYVKVSASSCCKCWTMRLCRACFATGQKENRFNHETKSQKCHQLKGSTQNALEVYCSILEENPKALDYMNYSKTG
jgi:uncharacterized protein